MAVAASVSLWGFATRRGAAAFWRRRPAGLEAPPLEDRRTTTAPITAFAAAAFFSSWAFIADIAFFSQAAFFSSRAYRGALCSFVESGFAVIYGGPWASWHLQMCTRMLAILMWLDRLLCQVSGSGPKLP